MEEKFDCYNTMPGLLVLTLTSNTPDLSSHLPTPNSIVTFPVLLVPLTGNTPSLALSSHY